MPRLQPAYASLFPTRFQREQADGLVAEDRTLVLNTHSQAPNRRLVRNVLVVSGGLLGLVALAILALGGRATGKEAVELLTDDGPVELVADGADECSADFKNCNETKCCKTKGLRCYEKVEGWATCRWDCVPGPDPTDLVKGDWSCKALGERAETGSDPKPMGTKPAKWVAKVCAATGEDCTKSKCCKGAGLACFKKNDTYSGCKPDCTAGGPDVTDEDDSPWDCKQLGMATPGKPADQPVADWVEDRCVAKTGNCLKSKCCKTPGHQCFQKDSHFAMCEPTCSKGISLEDPNNWKNWTCDALGSRTPGPLPAPKAPNLAPWVRKHCSDYNENCHTTQCCKGEASQCYSQDSGAAQCLWRCPGKDKGASRAAECGRKGFNATDKKCSAEGKPWACEELGPRTPRKWGTPTLYCMHVMRVLSYEADIIRAQLKLDGRFRGGIFTCDMYALYASDSPAGTYMGDGPLGPVRTRHFQKAPVWTSKDGTAANTALFQNVWEAVRWDMEYLCCDWTIKADPDAVILPDRLRYKLKAYTGRDTFIVTCNKGFVDGPMMFGAMEAMSSGSLKRYFNSESTCRNMPWQSWGEDLWLGKCLMSLGIAAVEDHDIVGDNLCYGANCGNGFSAAYHPFKNEQAWMGCYYTSQR